MRPRSVGLSPLGTKTLSMASNAGLVSALGTAQILTGVLNLGLGPGRTSTAPADFTALGAAYWLGAVFMVTGIFSIFLEHFPSPGPKCFTALWNLADAIFALAALVLYASDAENTSLARMCLQGRGRRPDADCRTVALLAQKLLTFTDATLMALAVLQLYADLSLATLVFKVKMMTAGSKPSNSGMSDRSVVTVTSASKQMSAWDLPRNCCSRPIRSRVLGILGTVQILVGVTNLGLGAGRTRTRPGDFASLGAAYWIGATFITAGVLSVLSGQCPSCCFASLTVTINVLCAIMSVVAVVLYALDLAALSVSFFCGVGDWYRDDGCREVASYAVKLTRGMDVTLLVLAVLVLCVSISASVLAVAPSRVPKQLEDDEEEFLQAGMKVLNQERPSLSNASKHDVKRNANS
ncbi:uncharacterized protein LOC130915191 [Corythoichthys intestinalis]|uniref:uncharacterized protein LOC130915191 n=1 Tax=Corythoichthys intestinalis TaxID=161448 RepID=UPI0025A510E7|nr:uncharacterized protein LOC130915191 [Corythoichthys intestinalis]